MIRSRKWALLFLLGGLLSCGRSHDVSSSGAKHEATVERKDDAVARQKRLEPADRIQVVTTRPVFVLYALESLMGYPIRTPRLGDSLCVPFAGAQKEGTARLSDSFLNYFVDDCKKIRTRSHRVVGAMRARIRQDGRIERPNVATPVNPEEVMEELASTAMTNEDFYKKLRALVGVELVRDFKVIFEIVDRRLKESFDPGRSNLQKRINGAIEGSLKEKKTVAFLERVSTVLGGTWPLAEPIRLVPIPIPNKKGSGARSYAHQAGQTVLVEILEDDSVAHRLSVAVHEMIHVLWFSLDPKRRNDIKEAFLREGGPNGQILWALLNEGLATAIGNGLYARTPEGELPEGAWYADEVIDQFARLLAPILVESFARNEALSDDFVRAAATRFQAKFPDAATDPRFVFREIYLLVPPEVSNLQLLTHDARTFLGTIGMRVLGPPSDNAVRQATYMDKKRTILLFADPSASEQLEPYMHVDLLSQLLGPLAKVETPKVVTCRNEQSRWYTIVLARNERERRQGLFQLANAKSLPLCDVLP